VETSFTCVDAAMPRQVLGFGGGARELQLQGRSGQARHLSPGPAPWEKLAERAPPPLRIAAAKGKVRACRAPFCHPPERFRCPFQPDHLMRLLCEQKRHGFLSPVTIVASVEGLRECAGCYSYDCVVWGALRPRLDA
jgi:hypothetical protein